MDTDRASAFTSAAAIVAVIGAIVIAESLNRAAQVWPALFCQCRLVHHHTVLV
jgi:hypothetical protein